VNRTETRDSADRLSSWALTAALIAVSPAVVAQQAPQDTHALDEIVVIGVTPVPGFKVDKDKIPGSIQTLKSSDLIRNGAANVLGALEQQVSAVNFNDTIADPFQPDVLFRGFEASPVLGTPEGMAVYQSGVRINEAFGDTVNWDLIPDIAIDRIDILSATSVFGLNALGGAANVTMKNGFTYRGFDGTLSGGSFNQRQAQAEYGVNDGALGAYVAVNTLKEGGWRHFAQDRIRQYYLDLSFHNDTVISDLSYQRDNNRLFGQGAAPVQSLAITPENVFTGPQNNINNLDMVTLNTTYNLTPTLSLSNVVYFRNFRQTVANGDNSDYAACDDDVAPGLLCDDDYVLTDTLGQNIPDITNGGTTIIGQNDYEQIHSQTWGGSLQFSSTERIAGHGNSFAVGGTIDTSTTNFYSGTWLGVINAALSVLPSPYFVATPEGVDSTATPVILNANNKYHSAYFTDTFDVIDPLSVQHCQGRSRRSQWRHAERQQPLHALRPVCGTYLQSVPRLDALRQLCDQQSRSDRQRTRVRKSGRAVPVADEPRVRSTLTASHCKNGRNRCAGHPLRRGFWRARLGRQRLSDQLGERHLRHLDNDRLRLLSERRLDPT